MCWIGAWGDQDPFYFRIQNPVVMVEYEHHGGLLLANERPEKFHTHSIVRTPNGNDYGVAVVKLATGARLTLDS